MILYHYTSREYLEAVFKEGLWKGDIGLENGSLPYNPRRPCVWLTTIANDPTGLSYGFAHPNSPKRQVRFEFRLSSSDPRLKHWQNMPRPNSGRNAST